MTLQIQQPTSQSLVEGVSTLYNVSWEQFKAIDAILDRSNGVKLSYLQGVLEIMAPIDSEHENVKSTLGLLLEAYMREKGIRFYRCGGFTIESPQTASVNPDESYAISTQKEIPDIVIEVIITSGRLDKKELYRPRRVPEVWFWRKGQITLFHLEEQTFGEPSVEPGYVQRDRSKFLPDLDLSLLKRYLDYPDQYDAVTELINEIRQDLR